MVRLDQTQNAFVFTTKIRSREFFFPLCTCFSTSRHLCHSEFLARENSLLLLLLISVSHSISKGKRMLTDSLEDSNFEYGLFCRKKVHKLQFMPPTHINLAFCHPLYLLIISSIVVLFCIKTFICKLVYVTQQCICSLWMSRIII